MAKSAISVMQDKMAKSTISVMQDKMAKSAISMMQDAPKRQKIPYDALENIVDLYGNRQWHLALKKALHVVLEEPAVSEEGDLINFKPLHGLEKTYDFLSQRYIDYVVLLKIVDESMQTLLHPQKRLLFKRFIEAAAFRICELKREMCTVACLNNHNLVTTALGMGLTTDDLQYTIPTCLLSNQRDTVQKREKLLSAMLTMLRNKPDCTLAELRAQPSKVVAVPSSLTYTKLSQPSRTVGRKDDSATNTTIPSAETSREVLEEPGLLSSQRYADWLRDPAFHVKVNLLQRCWRAWWARKQIAKTSHVIAIAMDMEPTDDTTESSKDQAAQASFQVLCKERDDEYTADLEQLREEYITSDEASFDQWQLKLNLRQWVLELRDFLGKAPPYPEPELGGCSALFTNKTVAEVENELDDFEENEKNKKTGKEEKKKEEKAKGGKEKEEGFLWSMPRTVAVPSLLRALQEYMGYWSFKDERGNLKQHYDLQTTKEKVRAEAEQTIRELVDAMMVKELELLMAVDREGKPKPEKSKPKKEKGAKGKKDPLAGRSEEELYAELVLNGVVKKPMQVTLSDIIGTPNMEESPRCIYSIPSPPELRMVLREGYGLPLSSTVIHSAMELRNSLLLAGPTGTGKTTVIHALAKETGSNLIDLSPVNMVGKFQGKKQEDYLLNVLLKICKAYEPSILLVDECHLLFPTKKARKRPDVDHDKPARWSKLLAKFMKKLKPGDRILLAGLTSEPFFAKTRPMCKLFQDVYVVALPDYGSRLALWKHYLDSLNLTKPHHCNVSVLARLSEGCSGADIQHSINECLTKERKELKSVLMNKELLPALVKHYPDDDNPDMDAWRAWFETTPLVQARKKLLEELEAEEEEAAAGKK